ncbi:MAG: DNA methylase N-4, partial [Actinomycetota bacterium]|nr:DNA methylase N-4 [Actinomycetota bacterium]
MTALAVDYDAFLRGKVDFDQTYGFDVDPAVLHPILKPHQAAIVRWALEGGRRAIFASFGLGKSLMQLEIMRQVLARQEAACLIVCPLGVRQEFTRDARMLDLPVRFVRRNEELDGPGLYLSNYESVRDGKLDPNLFDAASLDEASVLRSFGSKTYQTFLTLFDQVPYRWVATATPSPNRYKELIHYAGFLGVMDTGQALTRFFQRDSTQANNLTLYPHKEREFWLWLNSWAIFLQKPSDLGYDDTGYDLPDMEVVWHEVPVDHAGAGHERDGQGLLLRNAALGVTQAAREKRDTLPARVAKTAEIVAASPDDHFILWHDLEDERRALKTAIPEAVDVFGTLDLDERERRIIDFSDGKFRILATKPELSGSGCNFQRHCHRAIFTGVGFRFNDFYQALHRIHRFQQPHPVRVDIIYAESEREVVTTLRRKWEQHAELTATMSEVIREHGLNRISAADALTRSMGVTRTAVSGE